MTPRERVETLPGYHEMTDLQRRCIERAIAEAVAEEREACAEMAESHRLGEEIIRKQLINTAHLWSVVSKTIAAAIRARTT